MILKLLIHSACWFESGQTAVVMLGIGHYECNYDDNGNVKRLLHLNEMSVEYKNMLKLFIRQLNYSFLYQTEDNKIVHLTKSKLNKSKQQYNSNFKLKWTTNEIDTFISNIKQIFHKLTPDGLIFIVAARGFMDEMMVDSDGERYRIIKILSEFNNTDKKCVDLKNKTKLFILDLCTLQETGKETHSNDGKSDDVENSEHDNSDDENKSIENKETQMNDSESSFKDLCEYKDFSIIYKNSKILKNDYQIIDANCLLLHSVSNVFKHLRNDVMEFSRFVQCIDHETVALMVNEHIAWKDNYQANTDDTINIWECPQCTVSCYQLKNELKAILYVVALSKCFLLAIVIVLVDMKIVNVDLRLLQTSTKAIPSNISITNVDHVLMRKIRTVQLKVVKRIKNLHQLQMYLIMKMIVLRVAAIPLTRKQVQYGHDQETKQIQSEDIVVR